MTNFQGSSFDTSAIPPAPPAPPTRKAHRFGGFGPAIGAGLIVAGLGAWTQHRPEAVEPAAQTARVAPLTGPAAAAGLPANGSYADLVARVAPGVVTVRSERLVQQTSMQQGGDDEWLRRFFGQEG